LEEDILIMQDEKEKIISNLERVRKMNIDLELQIKII